MRSQIKRTLVGVSAVALVAAAAGQGTAAVSAGSGDPVSPWEQAALRAGVQLAPKTGKAPTTVIDGKQVAMPNPYLANTPDVQATDWSYWHDLMDVKGKQRARSAAVAAARTKAAGKPLAAPIRHDELEPETIGGANDTPESAEPIAGFGTGAKQNPRLRVLGTLPNLTPSRHTIPAGAEDNGSIPQATDTGIGSGSVKSVLAPGVLGDGPHGPEGDGANDFDFYKVTAPTAGLTARVSTEGSEADTVVGLYNSAGQLIAADDDSGTGATSLLSFDLRAAGEYYVVVAGHGPANPFPNDPNNSGSGNGGGATGSYQVAISASLVDKDLYSVKLEKGDIVGGTMVGSAEKVVVYRTDGSQSIGSDQDASSLYPMTSPLPGGGRATFAYVAEEAGWYSVGIRDGFGSYDLNLEVYRPGTESDRKQQTLFLDFDGARVNTAIFGGPGVRELSPFRAFLARWGVPDAQENQLIDRIIAVVTENVKKDLVAKGLNPDVQLRILNSRDHADPFGTENVSRIVVGGTVAEAGIRTIGIAQSIDPGNFSHEETALVLLDILSDPAAGFGGPSINSYVKPGTDRSKFVAQVVGNIVSHEAGHFLGSFHVDQYNPIHNLMDQGGNYPLIYGVGPDGIGGTPDDIDVDFGEDAYNPIEGFTGTEDTLNNTAWAVTKPKG